MMEANLDVSRAKHPSFELFHLNEKPTSNRPLHSHNHMEIIVVFTTRMNYLINNKRYHLKMYDVLVVPSKISHQPLFITDEIQNRDCLWVSSAFFDSINNREFKDRINASFNAEDSIIIHNVGKETAELISSYVSKAIETISFNYIFNEVESYSFVVIILSIIYRACIEHLYINNRDDSVASKAMAYINRHLYDDLSLDVLANELYVSKYHLSREFKKETGVSIHKYIINRRMIWARYDLYHGVSPKTVAKKIKYSSVNSFSEAFYKYYGVSPRYYLNNKKIPFVLREEEKLQ